MIPSSLNVLVGSRHIFPKQPLGRPGLAAMGGLETTGILRVPSLQEPWLLFEG